MLRNIIAGAVVLTLIAPAIAKALDADEIKALAAKPHDRTDLINELKIYPDAREYRITAAYTAPDRKPHHPPVVIAKEKVVEGKYVVSSFRPPGLDEEIIMVVTFDSKSGHYRKWVLFPDEKVIRSTGISAKGSKAIAWNCPDATPDGTVLFMALEQHSPMETTWTEIYRKDGKEAYTIRGSAKVTSTK